MAHCCVEYQHVLTVVEDEEKIVTLDMTEREAAVIMALLDRTGGHPDSTYRREADQVRLALLAGGVPSQPIGVSDLVEGGIRFHADTGLVHE